MLLVENEPMLKPLASLDVKADPLGLTPLPLDNRQRFLKFALSQENGALLPLDQILEVMQLSFEDILPVPDMPSCILGVCSWQGETLWLVDLNHLVGYRPLYQQSLLLASSIVIVVQRDGRSLGLVVEKVNDIELFDKEEIRLEPGLSPPALDPFVLGYCPQQGGTVLDISAIVSAPALQSHR